MGLQLDFDPTAFAPIERFECRDDIAHRLDLGKNLRRVDAPRLDHLDQPGDVFAVVAVTHVHGDVLVHRHADGKSRGIRWVDANDRQGAGLGQTLHAPFERLGRCIARLPLGVLIGISAVGRFAAAATVFRIDAYRIDHAVDANPAGQTLERFDRIFSIEVNDLRALTLGHAQTVVVLIDGKDAPGTQQFGAGNGELTDRTAAEHGYRVAGFDLGHLRAEIAGRENVREQDCLVIADFRRQFHQPDIGEGNARLFGLQSMKWACGRRAAVERSACFLAVWIGHVALGEIARAAVRAVAAGNGRGDHHAVADLQVAHVLAELFNDADTLMPKNGAGLHAAEGAAHEVQIRPANGRGGDAHNGVGRGFDLGVGYVFEAYVADIVIDHSFHGRLHKRSNRAWPGFDWSE